jgi:chemotaxis protein MotB
MIFPKRPRRDEEDTDAWLITYADMVTLLLCFFIIMFSMSSPNTTQFKKVAEALRKEGFYTSLMPKEDAYENLKQQFEMSLGASGYDQFMNVSKTPDAVEVELSSGSFFLPGQAKFTRDALPMLKLMAEQVIPLKDEDVRIEVEGYTDDSAVKSDQFPSNWELSAARAANVVRYLVAQGFPKEKLRAVGMADTHPKAPNRDATGTPIPANQDLNRRVVVKMKKGAD